MCNPVVSARAWVGSTVRDDFEHGLVRTFEEAIDLAESYSEWNWTDHRVGFGEASAYFGNPSTFTYGNQGTRVGQRLRTRWLPVLTAGVPELSFLVWLETEETPGFDLLRLLAELEDGSELELWSSDWIGGTTGGSFERVEVAAPQLSGRTVRLILEFDTVDGLLNQYEGAYVDFLVLSAGCCAHDDECRDGDACTTSVCPDIGAQCLQEAIEPCCQFHGDCDDGDPCTVDLCPEDGLPCASAPIDECCQTLSDCDDGDPCSEDLCVEGWCGHQPLCCTGDPDAAAVECDDGDPCTTGTCVEEQCSYEFTCCQSAAGCDDGDLCTVDQCVAGVCLHPWSQLPGCCVPEVYQEPFDAVAPPPGWFLDPPVAGVGWRVAAIGLSQSAPGVLYYGDPLTSTYDSGVAHGGKVLSGPVAIPAGVESTLSFWAFADIEDDPLVDLFWIEVHGPGGTQQIAAKSTLDVFHAWDHVDRDLSSLAGRTVYFSFHFDSVDALANDGVGVVLDDLQVTTTCAPRPCATANDCPSQDPCQLGVCDDGACAYLYDCCTSPGQCDDGQVCTTDVCVEGHCEFLATAGCCQEVGDCDDGDACTVDTCSGFGGQCSHAPLPGCCTGNTACEDADGCTIDQCIDHACVHTWICCAADAECDDGDDLCTADACVQSFCAYTPTGVEGCCVAAPVDWDFEVPVTFEFTATSPPCGWQVAATDVAASGGQTLWYGDPATGDFDCGLNAGAATSEAITLGEGLPWRLDLKLYLDVEDSTSYDLLEIDALLVDQGAVVPLWSKAELPGTSQWVEVSKDISALAGRTMRLRFSFDSIDDVANTGAGVFIDDVRLTTDCVPIACVTDDECVDDLPATSGACDLATCVWTIP